MASYTVAFDEQGRAVLGTEGSPLLTLIFMSLMIPRGTWFLDPKLGSRLHLLKKEKCLPRTERLLKDYVTEALRWLQEIGRMSSFDVVTERIPSRGRINYTVTAYGSDGDRVTYSNFVRVV
jgi:phage gp46-like protein